MNALLISSLTNHLLDTQNRSYSNDRRYYSSSRIARCRSRNNLRSTTRLWTCESKTRQEDSESVTVSVKSRVDPKLKRLGFREKPCGCAHTNSETDLRNWGKVYGGPGPHYITTHGVAVTMRRKGVRVRFTDARGTQHGPEQSNVGPAVAYAHSRRWMSTDPQLQKIFITAPRRK